jgi:hypothetical protein
VGKKAGAGCDRTAMRGGRGDRSGANNVGPRGGGGGGEAGEDGSGLKAHLLLAQKRNKMQRDGP